MHMDPITVEPFCLECGYDLAGLPQARCPECGTEFDVHEIVGEMQRRQMTMPQMLLRLLLAPAAILSFLLLIMFMANISIGPPGELALNLLQWFGWLVVWGSLVGGVVTSIQVARGLCWNRAIRRRRSPFYRHNLWFVNLLAPGLLVLQVFLAISGCFCTFIVAA